MMYSIPCRKCTPGLIIFMIDGGASMCTEYKGWESREEVVVRYINEIMNEMIYSCISGNQIKNKVFVSTIIYKSDYTQELFSGYIGDLVESIVNRGEKVICEKAVGHDKQKLVFLEPDCFLQGGATRLDEAYEMVYEMIIGWKESLEDRGINDCSPVPLVLNFTKGTISADISNLMRIINSIMEINSKDGHPLLYNVLIPLWDERKDIICTNETMTMGDEPIFWEISSFVPQEHKSDWLNNEGLQKGIILNPENSYVIWKSLVQPWIRPPYYNTSAFQ